MNVLQVNNLKKHFIDKKWWKPRSKPVITKAVDDISFEINEGEIVGLLGPNGAGKTTTTHILLGTLIPIQEKYFILGKNLPRTRTSSVRGRPQKQKNF